MNLRETLNLGYRPLDILREVSDPLNFLKKGVWKYHKSGYKKEIIVIGIQESLFKGSENIQQILRGSKIYWIKTGANSKKILQVVITPMKK